jgi:hypothetical protein
MFRSCRQDSESWVLSIKRRIQEAYKTEMLLNGNFVIYITVVIRQLDVSVFSVSGNLKWIIIL